MSAPSAGQSNVTCQHPVGHHHGTRVCYVFDKCRCDECTIANRLAARDHYRQKAREAWDPDSSKYVDTSRVRSHIEAIQHAGLGYKQIAARAGLHPSHIYPILWGRPDRNGGQPRTRVTRAVASKILAVEIPEPAGLEDGARIDATLARDRLRSLVRLGWSIPRIAEDVGCDRQLVDALVLGRRRTVKVQNARAIAATFFTLRDQEPRPDDWRAKIAVSRSRNRGKRAGWPQPSGVVAGPKSQDGRGADLDEFLFLVRGGEASERAALRLGVTLEAIERQARRKGRVDVLSWIVRAKP